MTVLSCATGASMAGVVTPIAVQRSSSATVVVFGPGGPAEMTDQIDRPYPAYPLTYTDASTSTGVSEPSLASAAHNLSTLLIGSTIINCTVDSQANMGTYPAGTDASITAYSVVAFTFSIDQPLVTSIHSDFWAWSRRGGGYSEARFDLFHDGVQAGGWSLGSGNASMIVPYTFAVGNWTVKASSVVWLGTDLGGPGLDDVRTARVSLEVTSVPAPGVSGLLCMGVLRVVNRRQRRSLPVCVQAV